MTKSGYLHSIAELGAELTAGIDRSLNLVPSLEKLAAIVEGTRVFVLARSANSGTLRIAGSCGFTAAEFRALETGIASRFWSDLIGSAEEVHLASGDDAAAGGLNLAKGSTLVATKLRAGKRIIGLLCIETTRGPNGGFPRDEILRIVSSMIAQNLRVEYSVLGERERLREENLLLKQELKEKYDFPHLVGTSNEMRHVYEQVSQVARSNATVLLRGESGTGKEMIAHAIHYNSLRSKRPFVKINLAALPDTLIESELFGHERGAFTGADRIKRGRFEAADGGTLFLDEIGDLPMQTQVKLLRVLQEREFERLGGTQTIRSNIRLVTATNKNLEQAIADGEFREDLYYRLNIFSIFLPPLRERRADIMLLAEHFLAKYEAEHDKRIRRISTPAIDMLMSYHYPGNVRELENAIERAVLVCDSNVIHGHHLPPSLQTAEVSDTKTELTLASAVASFERDLISDTLKSTRGNVAKAARQLESTERILGYKIKKYSIDPERFRQ